MRSRHQRQALNQSMSTPFEKITSLTADADYDNSIIEAIRSDKEHEAILTKIDEITGKRVLCG